MSYPEVLLWQRLRGSPMGLRFRRQHPIGSDYTADFYCPAARMVIEVDGEIHSVAGAPERDAVRDAYMRAQGLMVVRVPAIDLLRDADGTAEAIVVLCAVAPPPPAQEGRRSPSPLRGEDQGSRS